MNGWDASSPGACRGLDFNLKDESNLSGILLIALLWAVGKLLGPAGTVVAAVLPLVGDHAHTRPAISGTLPVHQEAGSEVACTVVLGLSWATADLYALVPTRTRGLLLRSHHFRL